jgi:hypothetical protein
MLNRARQLKVIVDWFTGQPVNLKTCRASDFAPTAWAVIQEAKLQRQPKRFKGRGEDLWNEISNDLRTRLSGDGGEQLADQLSELLWQQTRYLTLAELAETLEPVAWLWEKWLPIGMLSVLAARPGAGKSLVALDLIRKITAAEVWPDETPQTAGGSPCIYVDAENIPVVLNERAQQWEAWGMRRDLIYPVLPAVDQDVVNLADRVTQERIFTMALRLRPALIVVDSLRDVLPSGESAVEDVRTTLAYLSTLARENDAAVLLIHHLRKASNSAQLALIENVYLDDLSGSGYIGGRARVVMGLTRIQTGPEPDKNGPRRIEVVKSNLTECPDDLGIVFERTPPEGLRLTWTRNAPKRYEEPTVRDGVGDWLVEFVREHGPVAPKEVIEAAQEVGYSRALVYRMREELSGQIVNSKGRKSPGNCWQLAADSSKNDVD